MGVEDSVSIEDKPANAGLAQMGFDALHVSAFRQPDAARVAAKTASIVIASDENLRAQRGGMLGQQRQDSVRGGAGDYFQASLVLQAAKGGDQITVLGQIDISELIETMVVKERQFMLRSLPMGAMDLFIGQFDQFVQMASVAV